MKRILCSVVLILLLAAVCAQADTIFDSGSITFSATGTQFGRISRDGNASNWGEAKDFPGVTGAPAERGYELFTIDVGIYPYIQISMDDPDAALFDAAYEIAFSPVNSAPNYGLDVNYLGDPGTSEPFGNPSFFQIVVTPGSTIYVTVNEIVPGGGDGEPFQLLVEGFCDVDFDGATNGACPAATTPEPGSVALIGTGLLLLGSVRRYLSVEQK